MDPAAGEIEAADHCGVGTSNADKLLLGEEIRLTACRTTQLSDNQELELELEL